MHEPIGKRRRVIAERYIPTWSNGPEPEFLSHETDSRQAENALLSTIAFPAEG